MKTNEEIRKEQAQSLIPILGMSFAIALVVYYLLNLWWVKKVGITIAEQLGFPGETAGIIVHIVAGFVGTIIIGNMLFRQRGIIK